MINVQKLRDKINAKIEEDQQKAGERVDEWDAYLGEHRDEWVNTWGENWDTAARLILAKIKDRQVITEKDLPPWGSMRKQDRCYSEPYRFADGRDKPRAAVVPTEITQLLDALELLDEAEISHTALAKVGVTSTVMGTASRYLAGRLR